MYYSWTPLLFCSILNLYLVVLGHFSLSPKLSDVFSALLLRTITLALSKTPYCHESRRGTQQEVYTEI